MAEENVVPRQPLLLTVDEVAQLLGLSRRTVWRLRSTGRIPAPVRIGRSVRWRRADVDEWISARCDWSVPDGHMRDSSGALR
jgi:excisionase family DNA binding protein